MSCPKEKSAIDRIHLNANRVVLAEEEDHYTWATEARIANGTHHGGVLLVENQQLDSGEMVIQAVTGKSLLRLAWSWFRDNPVGFNGMPFVLFKTMLDLDPNHGNPTLRQIARIWRREAPLPIGSGPRQTFWTLDHLGIGPDPDDYVDGVAVPGQPA